MIALLIARDARSRREARVHPMITALAFAFLLRWVSFYVEDQVEQNPSFIPAVYGVPAVAGLIVGGLLMRGKRLTVADGLVERISMMFRSLTQRFGPDGRQGN